MNLSDVINEHLLGGGLDVLYQRGFPIGEILQGGTIHDTQLLKLATESVASSISQSKMSLSTGIVSIHSKIFPREAAVFAVSAVLISHISDDLVAKKYALSCGKLFCNVLSKSWDTWGRDIAESILHCIVQDGFFLVPVSSYLDSSVKIGSDTWRLANRDVRSGFVHGLSKKEIVRMILPQATDVLYGMIKSAKCSDNITLDDYVSQIRDIMPIHRSVGVSGRPPCVIHAIQYMSQGENLSHFGRFLVASWLLRAGIPQEDVCGYFTGAPDYSKTITKSQVSHMAKSRYMVPSCKKIASAGLCCKDETCRNITNPVQYGT